MKDMRTLSALILAVLIMAPPVGIESAFGHTQEQSKRFMLDWPSLSNAKIIPLSNFPDTSMIGAEVLGGNEQITRAIKVLVHLEGIGDKGFLGGEWAGTKGEARRIEGFSISLDSSFKDLGFEYMAHLQDVGDTEWFSTGQFCGTRGQSRRLEGFAVRLTGPNARNYDVFYQAHIQDIGDTNICTNGGFCGTRGEERRLEAIKIWLVKKATLPT
jgi:uncharacterized protein YjdB